MSLSTHIPNIPTAIAFSGGGDSTAMVHAFADHSSVTHAFIIDHALRSESASEAARSAEWARSLGYKVQIDRWDHHHPTTGVQVKARQYRYAALGRMCRAAGSRQLLTAHTQDDQVETVLMRLDRQTGWRGVAGMPGRAYAPLWPALWGVDLVRPWLDVTRAALRAYNADHGLDFVEDPSNENRDYTRVRARQALAGDSALQADVLAQNKEMRTRLDAERQDHRAWLDAHADIKAEGYITLDAVPPAEVLLHLLRAAAGTGGPIDRAQREAILRDMESPNFIALTCAGAWIMRAADGFTITRDKVAVTGRRGQSAAIPPQRALPKGQAILWDGRYVQTAKIDSLFVSPAFGNIRRLSQVIETQHISDLPECVRPTMPVFYHQSDQGLVPVGAGQRSIEGLQIATCAARRLHGLFTPQSRFDDKAYET